MGSRNDGVVERYLALDPGGTTGWCTYQRMEDGEEDWQFGQMGPQEHHMELWTMMVEGAFTSVVCESFEFRQGKQRAGIVLDSKEYIGNVKLFGKLYDTPVVFLTAGIAKGFVTDQKIKAMGLWVPGKKHSMDAARHMITFLVQRKKRYDLIESWKTL